MTKFKSAEFKKLQAEWYSKIQDSGFEDIEGGHSNTPYLAGVRGTSTVIDTAEQGLSYSVATFTNGVQLLEGLQGRQRTREHVTNRALGILDFERWMICLYLSHELPERDIAWELERSRGWVRNTALAYREACEAYARGELWEVIAGHLDLDSVIHS